MSPSVARSFARGTMMSIRPRFQKLGGLKIRRECLVGGLADDARSCEPDHAGGLGDDDVAQRRITCHDSCCRRVREHRDVCEVCWAWSASAPLVLAICMRLSMPSYIRAPPEAQTRTTGILRFVESSMMRVTFSPTTRPHRRGEEIEIHDADSERVSVDRRGARQDGIHKPGLFLVALEAVGIGGDALELQRVATGSERGVDFLKTVRIHETRDAFARTEREVVSAFLADVEVFLEGEVVDDFAAGRALSSRAPGIRELWPPGAGGWVF